MLLILYDITCDVNLVFNADIQNPKSSKSKFYHCILGNEDLILLDDSLPSHLLVKNLKVLFILTFHLVTCCHLYVSAGLVVLHACMETYYKP